MPLLENKNIKLRALEPHDADLLYKWENDTAIWQVSNTLAPISKYVLQKYIENAQLDIYQQKQARFMIYAFAEKNTVGCIDLFDFDPFHSRVGVGILVHNNYRNHGFASEALSLLKEYCFNYLNINQLYCNITRDNPASLKLFQKQGFTISGTKKQWIRANKIWLDEYFLQLIR